MRAYWRLGYPGWKIAAALGFPIKVKVEVCRDTEANVYFAVSDDIGLALEANSLDLLIKDIELALPELLQLAHVGHATKADIRLPVSLLAA